MADRDFYSALSKDEVLTVISRDLKSDNFKLISYDLKAASEDMMGFLGVHFKIHANIQTEPNEEPKKKQYFVKKMPGDIPSHREYAIKTRTYFKEISFYTRVIQDINNNMISGRNLTKWSPEFYFSRGVEIFVVEDLSAQGYYIYPERVRMDLEHIHAVLRAFAAMHAGSLILDEKLKSGLVRTPPIGWSPGQKGDITKAHSEIMFESEATADSSHPGNAYYEAGIKCQVAMVDLLSGYTPDQKKRIKERLPATLRKVFDLVKPSEKYRNVWTHGDLWGNNVMFKKDESGKVENAVIIDYQLARFAPPSFDILMFLHFVQSRSFLEEHQSTIIDRYFKFLSNELAEEGLDIKNVLPRSEFDESCSRSYEGALITQAIQFQFVLSPAGVNDKYLTTAEQFDHSFLVDRSDMVTEAFLTDEICRERFTEVMNELIEFYHLAD